MFPPSLPLIAKEILSSSRHRIDTHLIILCHAPLSCCRFAYRYRYRYCLRFNPRILNYLILGLRSYLLFIRLSSSSVQPVILLSHVRLLIFRVFVPASLSSHLSCPRVYVLSRPLSIFHLSVAPVIYTLGKVVMPFVGRHLCVSFLRLGLLGVSWTLPFMSLVSGCTMYPILVVLV
jgi:hypothetical protein